MKKKILPLILFEIVSFLTSISFAAEELCSNNEEIKNILNKGAYEPNYFQMFFGLFLVIVLVYFTGIIYQKLIKVRLNDEIIDEKNKAVIVSTTPLGQNKNLHVIKINNEYSLIATSPDGVSFLKDLKQDEENK